jgi:cytochrome P450
MGIMVALILQFLAKWCFLIAITYIISSLVYNIFFHPLRKFPGPLLNRATVLPRLYHLSRGRLVYHIKDIHTHHGPVVRIAPNELAFTDPQAWRDIFARQTAGGGKHEGLSPDMAFYNPFNDQPPSIISSSDDAHRELRKKLSPGFSERAMRAQEELIDGYVDLLMKRLRENSVDSGGKSQSVNMRDWIAYTTFDIIGSLTFGEDFGCLEGSGYHPWIALVLGSFKGRVKIQIFKALGILTPANLIMKWIGVGYKSRQMHFQLVMSKTQKRIDLGTGRSDFLDGLIEGGMSVDGLKRNATLLVNAGSETTATLLTGTVFLLATHEDVLRKLTDEVRSRFKSKEEITITSVNGLSYMLAVLDEALRCYPPDGVSSPRLVPAGGHEIAGWFVPEGTRVGIWQWPMYHDERLFTDPFHFDPDRFYKKGDKKSKYAGDRIDAVNAFLIGQRNCIGRNLAYAEMRLILARLVWEFDIRIDESSRNWMEGQENFELWVKPDLNIHLQPVN